MTDELQIISRKEALSLGLKRYFTGKPCRHGHVSERWVDGGCVGCRNTPDRIAIKRAYDKVYSVENRERLAAQNVAWREENKDKLKEYHRRPDVREKQNAAVRADRAVNPDKYRVKDRARYERRRDGLAIKHRARRYGLTDEQYHEMLVAQGGKCAITGWEETAIDANSGKTKSLSVDHCHKTGMVRGLLHGGINRAIGYFKEDTTLMRKAIEYIESHRDNVDAK
jgi:hypothetical protein